MYIRVCMSDYMGMYMCMWTRIAFAQPASRKVRCRRKTDNVIINVGRTAKFLQILKAILDVISDKTIIVKMWSGDKECLSAKDGLIWS